jgi:hypothetical protein
VRAGTSNVPAAGDWWQLPTGRTVSVRRIENDQGAAEAVVRYVDEQGAMAQGEFNLTLAFISRGRKVGHD